MTFLRDLRYGARSLLKAPGLMLVATIALAFGIGLTATMWSIIYGAMIKGLPYDQPDQIVALNRTNISLTRRNQQGVSLHDLKDWQAQQKSFSAIAGYTCGTINVTGKDKAERYDGCWAERGVLEITRVAPALGRLFTAEETSPGTARTAVIGYRVWQDRFAGSPDVVGQPIRVNGQPHTVIGVMPEGFVYPQNTQIWVAYQTDVNATLRAQSPNLGVVARLKDGVSIAEAKADLDVIAKRIEAENKATNENLRPVVQNYVDAFIGPEPKQLLYTMLGAVGFVLLIACANVANLLLDRAAHKTKEIGIRTALGATRFAVVRQFLAEAVVLAVLGAVLGTAIAQFGITAFNRSIADTQPPFFIDIRLHPPVLLFIVGVTFLASVLAGLFPAWQSARADINEILKDESRGASSLHIGKMSRALVVFEIALSCGLLVAAGLMTKSVTKLRDLDPGFDPKNLFTARIGFPVTYTDTIAQKQFYLDLEQKLAALPGVQGASVSSGLPGVNWGGRSVIMEGKSFDRRQDIPGVRQLSVSTGFFNTYGLRIRQGRAFTEADRLGSLPVAIVTQKFVETHVPAGQDPIGKRFRFAFGSDSLVYRTIVGVTSNMFAGDNENPWQPAVLVPFAQNYSTFSSMTVKTASSPMAITPAVRTAIASLNPDLPIYWVYSMEEALARPTWFVRVFGTMFMIFGFIALFLAGIGLYAVMAFSVSRRTREVGIRMALGATGGNVVGLIFRQGMIQIGAGLALGLLLAAGVSRLLSIVLFDVQPRDPVIFGGVVAVLAAAGLLACLIPARRAVAVDPVVALRD